MKAIPETIGNMQVLIQATDDKIEILSSEKTKGFQDTGKGFKNTGVKEDIQGAYSKAKELITYIAEDLGKDLDKIREKSQVKQMEVEFSIGFSAEAKPWVIFGAKADSGLKVKLTWQDADRS